ncbi:MAG: choice-of-anchor tandem repeat GloVer-containing protein, partial [Syntrophomonadaceae bacterium]
TSAGFESPGGTIFKLDPSNGYALTTLEDFTDGDILATGASPQAALIVDASGTLFGTTTRGGAGEAGVVFSLTTGVPAPVGGIAPTSGPSAGGTTLTVSGTGFTSPLTLRIGGALAADVTVVDSSEITGVTPPLPPGRLNDAAVTSAAAGPSAPFVLAGAFFSDFLDVPQADLFHADVEKIFRHGITAGCGAGFYCRGDVVTRAQMAVFLLKAKHGSSYVPPACTGLFADVACLPVPTFAADWIEQLAREGITSGCGGGNYCPGGSVTRAQMAVLLLKAEHGSGYVPPTCTGVFLDVACVPVPAFAADWIEQLAGEGITAGCGGGNYCPGNPVGRGQMAAFLVRTFGLP